MDKVVHDLLSPLIRSFIDETGFALVQKLANWLDARIQSQAAKVALGLLLGMTAVASVVVLTALAGF